MRKARKAKTLKESLEAKGDPIIPETTRPSQKFLQQSQHTTDIKALCSTYESPKAIPGWSRKYASSDASRHCHLTLHHVGLLPKTTRRDHAIPSTVTTFCHVHRCCFHSCYCCCYQILPAPAAQADTKLFHVPDCGNTKTQARHSKRYVPVDPFLRYLCWARLMLK